jgi:hypothetical protein
MLLKGTTGGLLQRPERWVSNDVAQPPGRPKVLGLRSGSRQAPYHGLEASKWLGKGAKEEFITTVLGV